MNREYRMLSFVERWAIAPRLHRQTVAEHSFFVALYASEICLLLGMGPLAHSQVLHYALRHDAFEAWTSDIPGPAKRSLVGLGAQDDYHDKFARTMGEEYLGAIELGNATLVYPSGKCRVRDIIKIADIIDSLFFLEQEKLLGNTMTAGLWDREYERFKVVIGKVLSLDIATRLKDRVLDELKRLANMGAIIPDNDGDIKPGPGA